MRGSGTGDHEDPFREDEDAPFPADPFALDDDTLAALFPHDTDQFRALSDPGPDVTDEPGPTADERSEPLPPDDRLWRHPSELRYLEQQAAGQAPSATPTAPTSRPLATLALVALGAGLAGALLATLATRMVDEPAATTVIERQIEAGPVAVRTGTAAPLDISSVAAAVSPAIVRLEVVRDAEQVAGGSGVVFRSDGAVMTSAHVIEDADLVRVVLHDGRSYTASVVGLDVRTDVAVLDIDVDDVVPATLALERRPVVGATAVAIGSPLGLDGGPTVTVGVVSAVGRELATSDGDRLYDLIQTDAPIAPGSSGGALLSADGAVIGITTAVAVSELGAEGLGFATPIDLAHDVATRLVTHGVVQHPWIGITGVEVAPAADGELPAGIEVVDVDDPSPAAEAGLEAGDVIVAADGEALRSMSELIVHLRDYRPGDDLVLELDGGRRLGLVLGVRPDGLPDAVTSTAP